MRLTVRAVAARLSLALLITGCAGASQVNEESRTLYVTQHPETPPNFASAILAGSVIIGMDSDMVQAAWGPPTRREPVSQDPQWDEKWTYGNYLVNNAVTHLYFKDGRMSLYEFINTLTQQAFQVKDPSERLALQSSPPPGETSKGARSGP